MLSVGLLGPVEDGVSGLFSVQLLLDVCTVGFLTTVFVGKLGREMGHILNFLKDHPYRKSVAHVTDGCLLVLPTLPKQFAWHVG